MQALEIDQQHEPRSEGKPRFWQRVKKSKKNKSSGSRNTNSSFSDHSSNNRQTAIRYCSTRNNGDNTYRVDKILPKDRGSPARTIDSKSTIQTRETHDHFSTISEHKKGKLVSSSSFSSSSSEESSQSSNEDNREGDDMTDTTGILDLARAISMKNMMTCFAEENIRWLGDDESTFYAYRESEEGQDYDLNTIDESVNFTFRNEGEATAAVFSELEVEPKVTKAPGFEHQDEDGDDIERKHKAVRSEQCLKDIPTNRKKRSIFYSRRKAKTEGKTERMGTIGGRKLVPIGKMKVFSKRNRVQSKGSITEMPQRLSVMELMGLNDIDCNGANDTKLKSTPEGGQSDNRSNAPTSKQMNSNSKSLQSHDNDDFSTISEHKKGKLVSSSSFSSSSSEESSQSSNEDNREGDDMTDTTGILDLARAISMKNMMSCFAEENIRWLGDDESTFYTYRESEEGQDYDLNTIDDSVNFTFRNEGEATAAVFSELEVEPKVTKAPGFEHQDEDGDDIKRADKKMKQKSLQPSEDASNRKKRSIFFSRRKAKTGKTERMGTIGGRKLVPIGKMKVFSNRNRVQSKGRINEMPQTVPAIKPILTNIDSDGTVNTEVIKNIVPTSERKLFSRRGKQAKAEDCATGLNEEIDEKYAAYGTEDVEVVTNITNMTKWKQNTDGSLVGIISNSQNTMSARVKTSPVAKDAKAGMIVTTSSGSKYYLI